MRKLILIPILILLVLWGCSTPNPEAPRPNEAHPEKYLLTHASEAVKDLDGCTICHGRDFQGTGNPVPGCTDCHQNVQTFGVHQTPYLDPAVHGPAAKDNQILCRGCHGSAPNHFDGGIIADPALFNAPAGTCSASTCHPAARAHPTNWQGSNEDIDFGYDSSHRTASAEAIRTSCVLCHKTDGPGTGPLPDAPSCFSTGFTNSDGITSGCHSGGFETAPHDLPYTAASSHGAAAKADLGACQSCHGIPGTTQFNGGSAATGCAAASCHPAAGAHPTRWQGSNDNTPSYNSTHRTAGSTSTACAICHNVIADAPGPQPDAPSCYTANFTNSDGVASACHAGGPSAPHAIPYTDAALHGPDAKADLKACQVCHGTPGTIRFDGGSASTGCSATGCHPAAGAHPTRWQGANDITPAYASTHRNAGQQNTNCSICHDFTSGRTAPDPDAPSCFSANFTNADGSTTGCHPGGAGAPHALPFTDGDLHGPDAKADLAYCQECHAQPFDGGPGSNPRFNVAIGNLNNGCEDCHTVNTAHPAPLWTGAAANSHKTAGNLGVACALCHGASLDGGVGPACADCHTAGDPLTNKNCTSCHEDPPDGNSRPNRDVSHSVHNALAKVSGQCLTCHNGSGTNTQAHYDTSGPANVNMLPTYQAQNGTLNYNSDGTCSGVRCHGGLRTRAWTETIDVDTECVLCHQRGVSQYSPDSGKHNLHLNKGFDCTDCHNVSVVSSGDEGSTEPLDVNHFESLDTAALDRDPARTMRNFMNVDTSGSRPSCSFDRLTRCHDTGDHIERKTW